MKTTDITDFLCNFDMVENALQMRTLRRWNGRDLRDEENLAEHTHLVLCCLIRLYDDFSHRAGVTHIDIYKLVKYALLHDSLELFRGDILSITKDSIPGLREFTDNEEEEFLNAVCFGKLNQTEKDILKLADTMACYKFIEWELRYPSNEFAKEAYIKTKKAFDTLYEKFADEHNFVKVKMIDDYPLFSKGYAADAGTDIILQEDVTFLPMSTTTVNLNVKVTPEEGTMSFLCARTSAANKGLSVATCPIDANYCGDILAIVHNTSNDIITYKRGESFCQYVTCKIISSNVKPKKEGKRSISNLGGTGNVSNT